ncbi:hypothetical protein MTR67_005437 [Solanum verrucosum]|uniref:Uncharacterized protein n=1 Tax=Solanum verrucosum TaxID=315347 RepID=A0AAF0T8P2_SOLVR|nr:hypothetical protein MTR67_005437 [Solanum verrucosum]
MAASSSSSLSESSSSSAHRDRKRPRRNRKDKDKDSLKIRKKSRSRTKRRRSRHSSSDSYSSSSSSEDYSSSDSEREAVSSSKRHIHKDRGTKEKKDKEKGKSHRQKRHKNKIKEKQQVESSGPVQLSKFLGRDKDDGVRRSAVSGKKILLKLDKTKEDKEAETSSCSSIPCFYISAATSVGSELICEELPVEMCALSIASDGKRCVLESRPTEEGNIEVECQTSEAFASNKMLQEYIETDECVGACGVDRQSLGLSSDALVDSKFIAKLCSHHCYNNCPNIIDLYSTVASAEGLSLRKMCASQKTRPRRGMSQSASLSSGAAAPVVSSGTTDANPLGSDPVTGADPPASNDPVTDAASPASNDPVTDAASPAGNDPVTDAASPAGNDPVTDAAAPTGNDPVTDAAAPTGNDPVTDADPPASNDPVTDAASPAGNDPVTDAASPSGNDPVTDAVSPAGNDPVSPSQY